MQAKSLIRGSSRFFIDLSYFVVALAVACCVLAMWLNCLRPENFFTLINTNQNMFIDFVKMYTGAKMILAGATKSIYDPLFQLTWLNQTVSPAVFKEPNSMHYPPHVFALMLPFAMFPVRIGYAVWCTFTFALGAAALMFLRQAAGFRLTKLDCAMIAFFLLGSVPSFCNILVGQAAWYMVAVTAFVFGLLLKSAENLNATQLKRTQILAGIAMAFSTVKPQYLLMLAPPLLIRKQWKIIAIAAVVELLLVLLAVLTIGWENVIGYPNTLLHAEHKYDNSSSEAMINLRGALTLYLNRDILVPLSLVSALGGLIAIAKLWFDTVKPHIDPQSAKTLMVRAIVLSTIIYLILSPHVHFYDGIMVMLPIVLCMPQMSLFAIIQEKHLLRKVWYFLLISTVPIVLWFPYLNQSDVVACKAMFVIEIVLLAVGFAACQKSEPETQQAQ